MALALHALAGFAGFDARGGGQNHLIYNEFGLFGMFFEIVGERLAHGLVHGAGHLGVAQFGLGLSLELRLGHLDGNHGGESFAEVFAADFDFGLFKLLGRYLLGVFLEHAGERLAEADEVGAALDGVDVVHIRVEILRIARIIHDCDIDGQAVFVGGDADDIVEEVDARRVDVAHELGQTFF